MGLFPVGLQPRQHATSRLPSHKTSNKAKTSYSSYQRIENRGLSSSMPKQSTNMSGLQCLATENIWFDKHRYDEAEKHFYEGANGPSVQSSSHAGGDHELISRMKSLELENQTLHKVVEEMRAALQKLESRVGMLEKTPASAAVPCAKAAPVKQVNGDDDDEDDDDIDLFGSD